MGAIPRWIEALGESADAVFVVDPSRRILLWNAAAEVLFGYSAEEVRGRRCCTTLAGRTCAGNAWCHSNCQVQRVVNRGAKHKDIDLLVRAKDGRDVCVNVSFIAIPHRRKRLVAHMVRSVENRERFKEALGRIRLVLRDSGALNGSAPRVDGQDGDDPLDSADLSRLTAREIEILSLLADGFSNEGIARRLCVSSFTVRNHVQNILGKLGLHSKAQAVGFAYKARLVV